MPISSLSKSNIKRATRILRSEKKYKKLSPKRKSKIRFKIAWNIQRGHVRKYGHR